MRIITLEDHFATALLQAKRAPLPQRSVGGLGARGRALGHDIEAELLDLGGSRIRAMERSGIDLQVVSLTMPGTEAFAPEIAGPTAAASDRTASPASPRSPPPIPPPPRRSSSVRSSGSA